MRYREIKNSKLKNYLVKLQFKSLGYTQQINTMVQASSPEMARRLLKQQYQNPNVLIGQPRLQP